MFIFHPPNPPCTPQTAQESRDAEEATGGGFEGSDQPRGEDGWQLQAHLPHREHRALPEVLQHRATGVRGHQGLQVQSRKCQAGLVWLLRRPFVAVVILVVM